MATFERLFDPASVERAAELTVTLANPPPGGPSDPPVVARYPGHRLTLLQIRLRAGVATHDIGTPARASVRRVKVDDATPLPGAITELLEISPLPFNAEGLAGVEAALRAGGHGVPTFYVAPFAALNSELPPPEIDDAFIGPPAVLATLTGADTAFVGVLFQDGVTVSPSTAFRLIGDALERANDAAGAAAWRTQLDLYAAAQHFRVVRHDGSPLAAGATFAVEVRRMADDVTVASGSVTLGADADLEAAIATAPVGPLDSLYAPPDEHYVAIRWTGEPASGESLAVHALYETGDSAPPGEFLRLPAVAAPALTLQVLELANWFPPLGPGLGVARYHTNSRVEPLVDGIPTFRKFVDDALAALRLPSEPESLRFRLHLASWALNRFQMDPGRLRTDIVEIAEDILSRGGSVLALQTTFININDPTLDDTRFLAALLLLLLMDATLLAAAITELMKLNTETDDPLVFAWFALPVVITILGNIAASIGPIRDLALEAVEGLYGDFRPTVDALNALSPGIAALSVNPARIADNPLESLYGSQPLFGLENDCDQFGVYHNKVQMVKRRADARGNEFVAYLGGIDVNRSRIDSPGHQISRPYHDVHARITGPAVADVFASFYERWIQDTDVSRADLEAELPPPLPSAMPSQPERHIARIGRTYPRTALGMDVAELGDRTNYDTILAAIREARDYIYIEDQYFTPNQEYVDALRDAGAPNRCKRLIILLPGENDQPFGDIRRRHVLDAIRDVWGARMLVGFPQRRPMLPKTDRFASRGRGWLAADCGPADAEIYVASPERVIQAPFWLWVDGELMLARDVVKPVLQNGTLAARVVVERGGFAGQPRWGAHPRAHRWNAPVTFSQVTGIFVHAKCMMVDDIFVSIGSTNINRRGFFSDGEINAFAVPEQLHAAASNPARELRTALWAEHLGMAPEMGAALLRDPIAAFDWFLHPQLAGNRFTPLAATDVRTQLGLAETTLMPIQLLSLVASLIGASGAVPSVFFRRAWNLCIDPTTGLDPAPQEGPV